MNMIHEIARFQDYLRECGFLTVTKEFGMRIYDEGDNGFLVRFNKDRRPDDEPIAHHEFDERHLPEFRFSPLRLSRPIESGEFRVTVKCGNWESEFITEENWFRDFIRRRLPQMINGLIGCAILASMHGSHVYEYYRRAYALNVMLVRFKDAMDQEDKKSRRQWREIDELS